MKKNFFRQTARALSLTLAVLLLFGGAFSLVGCSSPPDLSEIYDRLVELVNGSFAVNDLLFAGQVETYERVYEPTPEHVKDGDVNYYYYFITDETLGEILAFKPGFIAPYRFASLTAEGEAVELPDEIDGGNVYHALDGYEPPEREFTYLSTDPTDYDFLTAESGYESVADVKAAAEKIYTADYLASLYESLFDGIVLSGGSDDDLTDDTVWSAPRYKEVERADGTVLLAKYNDPEAWLTLPERVYDFSTARVVRPGNKNRAIVEISTSVTAKSGTVSQSVRITLERASDGQWYLASPTY